MGGRQRARLLRSSALLVLGTLHFGFGGATAAPDVPARESANTQKFQFEIPAGDLEAALQLWAYTSGHKLLVSGHHIKALKTDGLSGQMPAEQALKKLLAPTRLKYEKTGRRSIAIYDKSTALDARAQAVNLPQITIEGQASTNNPNSVLSPPPPFAGGQVATGSQLGMLGNVSVFDAPFTTVSYTAKTIEDQQARSIADVFANNPSVRAPAGSDGVYDNFFIRGFPVTSAVFTMNGLPGMAPAQMVSPYFIDRLELLNGPSGLLNNIPLFGYVGGAVNIVPKRATDAPITSVSTFFQSKGQPGTHVDVGRRFGDNKEFGIRVNGAYQDGSLASDHQTERLALSTIALDYRGDRLRLALDAGHQEQRTGAPILSMLYNGPAGPVPAAPRAGSNPFQHWSYSDAKDTWVMARGEFDITSTITAYAVAGYKEGVSILKSSYQEIEDQAGNTTVYPYFEPYSTRNVAAEAGVRAKFDTGVLSHRTNIGYAVHSARIGFSDEFFDSFGSNIYAPTLGPEPNIAGLSTNPPLTNTNLLRSVAVSDAISAFNERVTLIVGARYQSIDTANFDGTTGVQTRAYEATKVTPAVGVVVKPLSHVSVYANYIEGLAQGPTAPTGTTNAGQTFAPTVATQKEAGVKVDWGGWATTISVFEITQQSGFTNPATNTFEVDGEQQNRGIELNVFGEVTKGVRVLGGIAFTRGELVATAGGVNDGHTAPGVPDVTVNLGTELDIPFISGLTATGRMIYTSSQYLDTANTQTLPDWTRFDLGARYTTAIQSTPVTFRLNVENVANHSYWASSAGGTLSMGAPRRFLVSATAKF